MVVLLTLFYRGLLELSKSFLDPFGNDGSRAQNIYVDVIIQEVNGALDRLIEGSLSLPKLRDDPTLPLELSSGRRVDNVPPVADGGEEDGPDDGIGLSDDYGKPGEPYALDKARL